VILTLDLGTTRTKAVLWAERGGGDWGVVASGSATLATEHPAPGLAEQDASGWWPAAVEACAAARQAAPFERVEAIGFATARETFVPVAADGAPLGPAVLWSDRRGGGTVAGKVAWLRAHEAARLAAARWLLAPRDLLAFHMTGTVATDMTLASVPGGLPAGCALAPPVVAPTAVLGPLLAGPASALGVPPSVPVVVGAGDRQCEVLATGATALQPMVSWGTTANVTFPVASAAARPPLRVTRAALGGWLLEGGLAAAGALLAWVAALTRTDVGALAAAAALSPPGARGVTCLPWLGGARAPWWRPEARAGFVGLEPSHGPGDLARAAIEAVAFDVARCIEASDVVPSSLALAGGSRLSPWADVMTAVAGVPGAVRASPESASVGALAVTACGLGRTVDFDATNPVTAVISPPPATVERYREVRAVSDAAVAAALSLAPPEGAP
jgi:sugar (pentulose or hexulose) kinase